MKLTKLTHMLLFVAAPKRPHELRLPSEIFYTSNNCSKAENLNSVRVQFQSVLQATIRMQDACAMNPGECIVEDVVATCLEPGDESRSRRYIASFSRSESDARPGGAAHSSYRHSSLSRPRRRSNNYYHQRRRSASDAAAAAGFRLPIQFYFSTQVSEKGRWPTEYHKATTRLYGMFDYFENHVEDGSFTIRSLVTKLQVEEVQDSLTYAPVEAFCDYGYKFNEDILMCGKQIKCL